MDYGRLLNRAFDIVRNHLYLILLGVLVALSGGISGGNNLTFRFGGTNRGDMPFPRGMPPNFERNLPDFDPGMLPNFDQFRPFMGLPLALLIVLGGLAVVVGLILWILSVVARGGLVTAVDEIETSGASGLGRAWRAGMDRIWSLLGIALLPAIPGLILFVAGVGGAASIFTLFRIFGDGAAVRLGTGVGALFAALACVAMPIALVLGLLSTLANRACMLEGLGVIDSYRRSIQVLLDNLGAAIVLFLLQIAIGIAIGIVLFLPGLVMAVCFLLWPILLLITGAISAYFSALWTLAWRAWTGRAVAVP